MRALAAVALGVAFLGPLPAASPQGPPDLEVVDCHTHFYDPGRPGGVPWPPAGTPLHRTVLPKHLRAIEAFRPLAGTVVVEASPLVEDNAWLLQLAKDDPFVVGVVGNLEPGSPTFARNLERFAADPLFRGIRISGEVATKLLEADPFADLELLADRDLAVDVNGGGMVAARLAARVPKLRIVLNHTGHAHAAANGPTAAWVEAIRAAAARPNVFCKVSELVRTTAHESRSPGTTDIDFYRPYLDVVWDAFGEDRVIYASNWPVSESSSDYATLQRIAVLYAVEKGDEAARKFCSLNAKRAYRLADRP